MARRRIAAARRKLISQDARLVGDGVTSIAVTLRGEHQFSMDVMAPLIYASEMIAYRICVRRGWPFSRQDDVARYVCGALQEVAVNLVERLVEEHFEAWIAAGNDVESSGAA